MSRVSAWLGEAWAYIRDDFGTWLILGLLASIISVLTLGICYGPMWVGLHIATVARSRGEQPTIDHLFQGFRYAAQAIVASLIMGAFLLVVVLAVYVPVLLAVPCVGLCMYPFVLAFALLLQAVYALTYVAILQENLSAWNAMERSRRLLMANSGVWIGLAVLMFLTAFVGVVPFIGPAFYWALWGLALTFMYRDMTATEHAQALWGTSPPPQPGVAPDTERWSGTLPAPPPQPPESWYHVPPPPPPPPPPHSDGSTPGPSGA